MGWIGIADNQSGMFQIEGLEDRPDVPNYLSIADGKLLKGTLLFETKPADTNEQQTLLAMQSHEHHREVFAIKTIQDKGLVMVDAQSKEPIHKALALPKDIENETMRITYTWDVTREVARLTCELPDLGIAEGTEIKNPNAIAIQDLYMLLVEMKQGRCAAQTDYLAISGRIEPVGPMPGLTGVAEIMTPQGAKPIHTLKRGDLVVTDQGESQPILNVAHRRVPCRGSFRPICLRAPFFNLTEDLVVAPQQRLALNGTDVEYTFTSENVLIAASRLIDSRSAYYTKGDGFVTYYNLLLPNHEVLDAAGCLTESLYIGRLRRKSQILKSSVLSGVRKSNLPEHAKTAYPVLKEFEAAALNSSRVA